MRPYLRILALSWQVFLVNRLNLFLHALIVLMAALAVIYLWQSLYLSQSSVGGYNEQALLTYLVGAMFFNGIVSFGAAGDTADRDINEGKINQYLVRPWSALGTWLTKDLARHGLRTLFLLGTLAVLVGLFHQLLLPPVDPLHGVATVAMVALAYGIVYYLMMAVAFVAFWVTDSWSFRFGFRVVAEFATGAAIPLTFFPDWLQSMLLALPFKFLSYLPMQFYLGRLPDDAILQSFGEAILWLAGSAWLAHAVWRKGIRIYDGVGL